MDSNARLDLAAAVLPTLLWVGLIGFALWRFQEPIKEQLHRMSGFSVLGMRLDFAERITSEGLQKKDFTPPPGASERLLRRLKGSGDLLNGASILWLERSSCPQRCRAPVPNSRRCLGRDGTHDWRGHRGAHLVPVSGGDFRSTSRRRGAHTPSRFGGCRPTSGCQGHLLRGTLRAELGNAGGRIRHHEPTRQAVRARD